MDAVTKALDFDLEEALREEKERRAMMQGSSRNTDLSRGATSKESTDNLAAGSHSRRSPYHVITSPGNTEEPKKLKKTKKTKEKSITVLFFK